MARVLKNKVTIDQLSNTFVYRGELTFFRYDDVVDTFFMMFAPPETPTVVMDIDDHIGLLYDPKTKDVVGFQVESFLHSFIHKHAALKEIWFAKTPKASNFGRIISDSEQQKPKMMKAIVSAAKPILKKNGLVFSELTKRDMSYVVGY